MPPRWTDLPADEPVSPLTPTDALVATVNALFLDLASTKFLNAGIDDQRANGWFT